ncbi:MAG: hypothetical protein ACREBG_10455 [Pyrinomonadaceae bacterium]
MKSANDLPTRITKLIRDYTAESTADPLNLRQLAAEKNVLPLIWDMGGVFAINPSCEIISFPFGLNATGDIVAFPFDEAEKPRVESDLRLRNNALFGGSKKYPELKELIVKPNDAQLCSSCGGTGIDRYAEKLKTDAIVCYCGGLGWIP